VLKFFPFDDYNCFERVRRAYIKLSYRFLLSINHQKTDKREKSLLKSGKSEKNCLFLNFESIAVKGIANN